MKRLAPMFVALATLPAACGSADAPISDGSFVTYEIGGTRVQITFEATSGGDFRTVGAVTEADGSTESAEGMPGHGETVDAKMRTAAGGPLQVAAFGPIWASPSDLEQGGRVYGSSVSEVRTEGGRPVAVVAASAGVGAALQGSWVYDVSTGFLLNGAMGTALSGVGGGQQFRLVATNVPGLQVP